MRKVKVSYSASTAAGNTQAKEKTSQMSQDSFGKGIPYDKKNKRWNEIANAITMHIAKDMVLLSTVEKEGFKMMKTLDPRYELPSRKYFNRQQENWRQSATSQQRLICGLVVLWSATLASLFTLLATNGCCKASLQTSYFPEDHTGEILAAGLQEALDSWGLPE